MTKVRTSDLIGAQLDWAVALCIGTQTEANKYGISLLEWDEYGVQKAFTPSTDWSQGGPIIEREGINIRALRREGHTLDGQWLAAYDHNNTGTMVHWVKREDWPRHYFSGITLLVAAMRAYVASKLGYEVDIPEELL